MSYYINQPLLEIFLLMIDYREEELVYEIADFLWNNGNEVFLKDTFNIDFSQIDGRNALDYCDCAILFKSNKPSESEKKLFNSKDFELFSNHKRLIVLLFYTDGVYSNAIPYSHKIYDFEALDKNSLINFQNWSKRLKLLV